MEVVSEEHDIYMYIAKDFLDCSDASMIVRVEALTPWVHNHLEPIIQRTS